VVIAKVDRVIHLQKVRDGENRQFQQQIGKQPMLQMGVYGIILFRMVRETGNPKVITTTESIFDCFCEWGKGERETTKEGK
jgi:hypothetical protein